MPPQPAIHLAVHEITENYLKAINSYFNRYSQSSTGGVTVPVDAELEEQASKRIVDMDVQLEDVASRVSEHQRLVKENRELERQLNLIDTDIQSLIKSLVSRNRQLDNWLVKAAALKKTEITSSKREEEDEESVLIEYGRLIAGSCCGPHGWEPGQDLGMHLPPCPQEDQIRGSLLFQHRQLLDESQENDKGSIEMAGVVENIQVPQTTSTATCAKRAPKPSKNLLSMDLESSDTEPDDQ